MFQGTIRPLIDTDVRTHNKMNTAQCHPIASSKCTSDLNGSAGASSSA